MIRRLAAGVVVAALMVWANCALAQQSYPLLNGEVLTGDPVSFNQQGVVLKRSDGSFTSRVSWTNFTETALKQLGQNPKAKPFVDQLIEAEEEEQAARKGTAEITVKPPPRIERANFKAGIGALFSSPLSLFLLFIVWAANIYAAFEVSIFRNYPWPLVCGVAAVVPIIGPILFGCLPSHVVVPQTTDELMEAHYAAQAEAPVAEIAMAAPAESAPAAAPAHAAPAGPPHTVYKRGQTTFNRRFFETKLANFLRVTPSEADKDMVLFIKSSRGEHTGARITRITPDSLHLHVVKSGASHDVDIPFTEIAEVHVKHKDS